MSCTVCLFSLFVETGAELQQSLQVCLVGLETGRIQFAYCMPLCPQSVLSGRSYQSKQ